MKDPLYIRTLTYASDELERLGHLELASKVDRAIALLEGDTNFSSEPFDRIVVAEHQAMANKLGRVSGVREGCYRATLLMEATSNITEVRNFLEQLEEQLLVATSKEDLVTDAALVKGLARIVREWS